MRYSITNIIKDNADKRRFATTLLPVIPITENDIYIKTTSIERLDKLAQEFYDEPSLWWIIAACNNLGKGSLIVPRDTTIRIPPNDSIREFINNANTDR